MPRLLVSTYGRTNETDAQVFADGAELEGGALGFIAYGVHATLYFLCLALFWQERKQKDRRAWPWIAYMTVLFIVGSIINGLNVSFLKADFIDNRDYPGGPSAFTVQNRSLPSRVCTVITVIGTWFVDGLLVFRFYVILGPSPWAMIIPCGMYMASISFSFVLLYQLVAPGSTLWTPKSINLAVMYWSTSVAINAILTVGIVVFLLHMRRAARQALGPDHKIPYLSISAMLIESAFLYTAFALVFLVPLAINSGVNLIFDEALEQVQFIAPLLIMARVAKGRAVTRQKLEDSIQTSARRASTLRFGDNSDGLASDDAVGISHPGVTIAASDELKLV